MVRAFCLLVVGGLLACRGGHGLAAPAPAEAAARDSEEVKKLLKQRVEVLKKALKARQEEFKAGRTTLDAIIEVMRLLHKAELEVASNQAERITAHLDYFKVAKEVDNLETANYNAGRATVADSLLATAERLKAEIGLRRAGGKPPAE